MEKSNKIITTLFILSLIALCILGYYFNLVCKRLTYTSNNLAHIHMAIKDAGYEVKSHESPDKQFDKLMDKNIDTKKSIYYLEKAENINEQNNE